MPGLKKSNESNQAELLLHASPLIKKFFVKMAEAAKDKPILDIACGTGRNAFPLAAQGCTVICADKDMTRFRPPTAISKYLIPRPLDLIEDKWPFKRLSAGGIVNVHFLLPSLFSHFERTLARGAYLLLETPPGCGGNHFELPKAGYLHSLLKDSFHVELYKERSVGPPGCGAVAVKIFARKI
jgi:SAM-dependent methyltransferase